MAELSDANFALKLDMLQEGRALPNDVDLADAADLALATRMFQMRVAPSQGLMARLKSISATKAVTTGPTKRSPFAMKNGRQLTIGVALSLATLLTVALIYPPTRLAIAQGIEDITFGIIHVRVVQPEVTATFEPGQISENYGFLWKPSNWDEVQTNYPTLATIPTWSPAGFELKEFVAIYYADFYAPEPLGAVYEWQDNAGHWIQLDVLDYSCPEGYSHQNQEDCAGMYMETASPIFVTVKGEQALIAKGRGARQIFTEPFAKINPSRWQSLADEGVRLYWQTQQKLYTLRTLADIVSQEDLIRMLESIP